MAPLDILNICQSLKHSSVKYDGLPHPVVGGWLTRRGLNSSYFVPGLSGFYRLSGLGSDGRWLGRIRLPRCATRSLRRFFGSGARRSVWLGSRVSSLTVWWHVVVPVWNLAWPFDPPGWWGGFCMGRLTPRSLFFSLVGPLRLEVSGCLFCRWVLGLCNSWSD